MLDRTGSGEYETRLGGVSTLEDIGRVGEMIKTRSTVRDSLEAVRNVAPGSGSGVNQGKVSTISKDAAVNAVAAKASGTAPSVVVAQPPPAPPAKSGDKTDTVIIEMGWATEYLSMPVLLYNLIIAFSIMYLASNFRLKNTEGVQTVGMPIRR